MTTPTFASAKEARDARWFSRRHETAESRHESFRYCPGGKPNTRRDRQESALQRHQVSLMRYEGLLYDLGNPAMCYPKEWSAGDVQQEKWRLEYKIRVTKRIIAGAGKNLGIEENYALQA